jgi:hypothetical protein
MIKKLVVGFILIFITTLFLLHIQIIFRIQKKYTKKVPKQLSKILLLSLVEQKTMENQLKLDEYSSKISTLAQENEE